jgi:hypothetical protein
MSAVDLPSAIHEGVQAAAGSGRPEAVLRERVQPALAELLRARGLRSRSRDEFQLVVPTEEEAAILDAPLETSGRADAVYNRFVTSGPSLGACGTQGRCRGVSGGGLPGAICLRSDQGVCPPLEKRSFPGKAGPLLLVQSSIRLHPQPGGLEGRTTIVRTVEGRRVSIDDERPPRERRLRDLIAGSPSLLPDVDERPAAVSTEVRISGAGKADVIVVDAGGEITIVECKLAKNPQMRRWVIGQLFEYAAALWRLDIEDLERGLAAGGTASTEPFKDTRAGRRRHFAAPSPAISLTVPSD